MKKYLLISIIKKNLTRFAPVWGLYTIFLLISIVLLWESGGTGARLMNYADSLMATMGILNLVYAAICALTLFGDLFSARLCYALHAMPVRRECWFFSHILSGLLFCLIPTGISALIGAALLGQYAYGALLWLAVTVLEFLFFFGAAVFSCLCAGTKLGAAAVYALVNFLPTLILWFVQVLLEPLLYGITLHLEDYEWLCPVSMLTSMRFILTEYDNMESITVVERIPAGSWWYVAVLAAVGILLGAVSLVLYKKRQMETAGDLLSVKVVRPVLTSMGALCLGVLLYAMGESYSSVTGYFLLVVGLLVGYFCCRMLVEKQVKVFGKKNWLGAGILVLAVAAVMITVKLDPVGVTRYVPEKSHIVSVTVHPYGAYYYIGGNRAVLTQDEDVESARQLHQKALQRRDYTDVDSHRISLEYTLKDGRVVRRSYYTVLDQEEIALLHSFYSRPDSVMDGHTMEQVLSSAVYMEAHNFDDTLPSIEIISRGGQFQDKGEQANAYTAVARDGFENEPVAKALISAIYQDCEAGVLSQWRTGTEEESCGYIYIELMVSGEYKSISIEFNENCTNILAVMEMA